MTEMLTVLPPVLVAMVIAAGAGVGVHRLIRTRRGGSGA